MTDLRCPVCGNVKISAFVYDGAYQTKWHYKCEREHCGTTWAVLVDHPFNVTSHLELNGVSA